MDYGVLASRDVSGTAFKVGQSTNRNREEKLGLRKYNCGHQFFQWNVKS